MSQTPENEFARRAEEKQPGLLRDLIGLVRRDKKWWLVPILASLLLIGLFVVLASTALGPFLYTLF